MVRRYTDYAEFLATARDSSGQAYRNMGDSWAGGTYTKCLDLGANGNDELVNEAEKLLEQIAAVENGEAIREWTPSPVGAYPVVPDYLAGHPYSMRAMLDTDNRAPISIYVCTTISAMLNAEQIMKRGTAILALVLQLQKTRSVELYVTAETHGQTDGDYIQVIPIESKPLSISHACNALTGLGFARQLTYTIAKAVDGFNGSWGKQFNEHNGMSSNSTYPTWIRGELGCAETDMYIKPGHVNDPMINTPVEWVNEQLARYNAVEV